MYTIFRFKILSGIRLKDISRIAIRKSLQLFVLLISVSSFAETPGEDKSGSKGSLPLIRLVAGYEDNADSFDPLVIYYNDNASYNYDGQYDALKMFNSDTTVANYYVFSKDNRQLSISGVPFCESACDFKLGIKTEIDGNVAFRIKDLDESLVNKTIIIKDNESGTEKVLRADGVFSLWLPAGHYTERFTLTISSATTDLNETPINSSTMKAYLSFGRLKVEISESDQDVGFLSVYNLSGRLMQKESIPASGTYEFDAPAEKGVYLVSYVSNYNIYTSKIFVGYN